LATEHLVNLQLRAKKNFVGESLIEPIQFVKEFVLKFLENQNMF